MQAWGPENDEKHSGEISLLAAHQLQSIHSLMRWLLPVVLLWGGQAGAVTPMVSSPGNSASASPPVPRTVIGSSNYTPWVQAGKTDFKNIFAPTSSALAISAGEVILPSRLGVTVNLTQRLFIPPGVKSLELVMYTFASSPESKVLLRFGAPPVGAAENVTQQSASAVNLTTVLQNLTANGGGVELPFWAPASAGSVRLSSRSTEPSQPILATTGGWIYINALAVPGNQIYQMQAAMIVDETCYRTWYANALWDAAGNPAENATHTCAGSSAVTSTIAIQSLTGPLTLQSGGRSTLIATAKSSYSDGNSRTVTPVWTSSNPAVASVSASGILSAGSVEVDTPVTLTATFSDNGVTVQGNVKVTVTAAPALLSGLQLSGASSVQSGGQVRLTVSAQYADGSSRAVAATGFSLSNAALGAVNVSRGVLTVSSVTVDTPLTIAASYLEGGITKSASLSLTISAAPVVLSRLTVVGAQATLEPGQSLKLSAQGVYADGSRKAVTVAWQSTGSAVSISSSGVLTAKSVTKDETSLVTGSYTEAGVTVSAQYLVVIQAAVAAVTPVQAEVETTGTQADFGLSIWTRLNPITGALGSLKPSAQRTNPQPAASGRPTYKMFVAALIPGGGILEKSAIFVLNRNSEWQALGFPVAEYLSGVAESNDHRVDLFDHFDAKLISGTQIFIGFGLTDEEMLKSGRFKLVAQLQ
jgi:hypothetical protein